MVSRRGQLILTAAILIGLTIVASAVLLNQVHASADVQAQQERQSLDQTEQIIEQLNDDLEKLFVANGSQESLPYVDDDDRFGAAVDEFVEQYMNISTRDRAGFVDVEYLDGESEDNGNAVWQNESEKLEGQGQQGQWQLVAGQSNITYLKLHIVDVDDDFRLITGDGDIVLTDDVNVSFDGARKCTDKEVSEENPLAIEVTDGEGEISAEGERCASMSFGTNFHNNDISIPNSEDEAWGEIYITFVGGQPPPGQFQEDYRGFDEDVVVQPVYQLTYQDSQITYQTNVTAYGGEP